MPELAPLAPRFGVRRQSEAATALFLDAEPIRQLTGSDAERSALKTKRCRRFALPPHSKYAANQHVTTSASIRTHAFRERPFLLLLPNLVVGAIPC